MAILQMDNIMSQNAYGCANCKQSFPMAKYLGIHYQNKECYKVGYSQEKNGKEKVKVKKRKIKSEEKKIKSLEKHITKLDAKNKNIAEQLEYSNSDKKWCQKIMLTINTCISFTKYILIN